MPKVSQDRPVVGVDMGGTKILAAVVSESGKILGNAKRATKAHAGPEEVINRMAQTVQDAVADAKLEMKNIAGVCTGAPGPLDPDSGIVWHTPNLVGWDNVPLASLLSKGLGGLPVFIENDVNVGTLGEYAFGAGAGAQDVIGVFVGTGIGGGLILGGELRQGWRKAAAEVGHMVVLADGPYCGCGKRGCVEALASRTAMERDIWAGIKAGRESLIPEIVSQQGRGQLTSGALADAFRRNDPLVTEIMGRAQYYLGILVANLVNVVDPEVVVLGGGVVEALGEDYLEPVRMVAFQYFFNRSEVGKVRVLQAKLGDNAGVLGAAVVARKRLAAK